MWHFKRKKVPYVAQLIQTECGLCCITMILRYYGNYQTLNDLREYMEIGRDGLRLRHMGEMLEHLGFKAKAYKTTIQGLRQLPTPSILHWENNHYVVLEELSDKHMIVVDPAYGRRKIPLNEAEELYSGYVLSATPTEEFKPKKKKRNVWFDYTYLIFENKKKFLLISALTLSLYLMTLAMPVFIQFTIDRITNDALNIRSAANIVGIGSADRYLTLLLLSLACAFFASITFFSGKKQIDYQIIIDRSMSQKVIGHLLKLPYKFFDVRSYGDLVFRLSSLHIIRDIYSQRLINFFIDCGAILIILGYMVSKSLFLAAITFVIFIISGTAMVFARKFILEANQYEIVENSKMQSLQIEILYSILGIKIAGMEKEIYAKWEEQYDNVMQKNRKRSYFQNIHDTVTSLIKVIVPLLILMVGVNQFINKRLSLGEVIAFYSMSNIFFGTTVSIFQAWNNFLLAAQYLERVQDITNTEPEKVPEKPIKLDITGEIRMENVSFSYTQHSQEVLQNINLNIKSGQKIAIVGPSGSGKSTLSKILIGLYMPTKGKVFYDDINLDMLDKPYLRKQMGVVPQDISLLNKTIFDNIKMNKENINFEDIKRATQIANIYEEIESMPMKYYTLISDMGANLSGGQRQRIALARAIINNPKIILLDEATSSLDAINESKVSDYFKNNGCTRIVISHRLSTIIDSDMIYVMNDGKIIEQGNHDALIEKKGFYYTLYKAQL
jgi:ABC-type bacteriocin/lantibiotic exporter with double-glycine peptidase domain